MQLNIFENEHFQQLSSNGGMFFLQILVQLKICANHEHFQHKICFKDYNVFVPLIYS